MDEQIFNDQLVLGIYLFRMVTSCIWWRKSKIEFWFRTVATTLGAIDSTRIRNCDGWSDRERRNLQSKTKASQTKDIKKVEELLSGGFYS